MDALTYLENRCSLRHNVLTGEILYAPAGTDDYRLLSAEAANALLLLARRDGVDLSRDTLDLFVHSTLVEQWNPATSWLDDLEEWDGEDHVFNLAQRIVTSNPDWPARFHKFMLQMVARWRGYTVDQRDQVVPVIVGQFGYGKTSFCNALLPPALRRYYSDQIHVRQMADVQALVTTNLLLCLDEFYQDNTDQQAAARYIFAKSTPAMRLPYGVTREPRRPYAAFIAATGNLHPMTDAAGAARLVCVEISHPIDLKTPIPYEQLYAQLATELDEGADYTLTDEEREAMAVQNSPFQEADNLVKMVSMLYAAPPKGKKVKATYIDAIIDRLMKEYPYWTPGDHVNQDVGFALQDAGFTRTRIHGRSAYKVVEKDPRKMDAQPVEDTPEEDVSLDNNPLARALLAGLGGLKKP